MNLTPILQFASWTIALVELIVALYVLALNAWHDSNRHVSALLLILAASTYATGLMTNAAFVEQMLQPAILMAGLLLTVQPALLLAAVALLKPDWLRGRRRLYWLPVYALIFLPALLTWADLNLGTHLFFSGVQPAGFFPGLVFLTSYTAGSLGLAVRILELGVVTAGAGALLAYSAFLDKKTSAHNRGLARLLLLGVVTEALLQTVGTRYLHAGLTSLLAYTLLAIAFGYAVFRQVAAERRLQKGHLVMRLTALVLVAPIPMLIAVIAVLNSQAGPQLEQAALENLHQANRSLVDNTNLWLQAQSQALQTLSRQVDLQDTNAAQQKVFLKAVAASDPGVTLVSLLDLLGHDMARSDDTFLSTHVDQTWFKRAAQGEDVIQAMEDPGTGLPGLVLASPVRSALGQIQGVVMLRSNLSAFQHQITLHQPGKEGYAFIVDSQNQVLAYPNQAYVLTLRDMSSDPAVGALRGGKAGFAPSFVDANGRRWQAYGTTLSNGWGVIVQQPEDELLAASNNLKMISYGMIAILTLLVSILVALIIRQGLHPIRSLTQAVEAISAGDLGYEVPLESEDELGALGQAFNSMTGQLRELIAGLEGRVAERTMALERRALQLQVASEVAREAAGIRNLEQLLDYTAHLISERFGFYQVGIFLLENSRQYAVLRAASSNGGQRMLERGHKLKVAQEGIVGNVADTGKPRIALDVDSDRVWFNNPDLPETRSEAALPLSVREQVIGVLDVQSSLPSAFSEEDVKILQVLADQIALAIENARLINESQQAFKELETLYSKRVEQAWIKRLATGTNAYAYDRFGVRPVQAPVKPQETGRESQVLKSSIELRGQLLGTLVLRREPELGPWTPAEQELVRRATAQVAQALENARLLEEARHHAEREQQINVIASQVSTSANIETVLQSTVRELGKALGAARTYIQLTGDRS